jgi:glycosyltransferase involved in cell wall biosynthesis
LLLILDRPENPYREMLLIGTGPAEVRLKSIAANMKWLHVKFLPWLDPHSMDTVLGLEDCLILNSRWEGEPLVVREFSARGLPCVARNIAGVRGVVPKKHRYGDEAELFSIMKKLYLETPQTSISTSSEFSVTKRLSAIKKIMDCNCHPAP